MKKTGRRIQLIDDIREQRKYRDLKNEVQDKEKCREWFGN